MVSPGEALAPVLPVPPAGVHAVVCRCCSMPVAAAGDGHGQNTYAKAQASGGQLTVRRRSWTTLFGAGANGPNSSSWLA